MRCLLFALWAGVLVGCLDGDLESIGARLDDEAAAADLARAIPGGAPDHLHPAVGRIAVPHVPGGGCSGTLIAPRLVLTAKHCFSATQDIGASWFIGGQDPAAPAFLARGVVGFEAGSWDGDWVPEDDLYVVALDRVPVGITPLPYGSAMDEDWIGADVLLVGYGLTGAASGDDGTRRMGLAWITELNDRAFATSRGPAATCFGDSGGAVVRGGTVIGVIARGDCSLVAGLTRVDAHEATIEEASEWIDANGGEQGDRYSDGAGRCACDRTVQCDDDRSGLLPAAYCPCDPEC